MRLGVFKNLIAEAVFYEIDECMTWNCADAWARGCERDDEFAIFIHNAERPNGAVEGLVFGLQDATFLRVQEGAGHFFFGIGGFVSAKDNLTVAELPHHTVFVRLAEFFNDFGREQRRFPEALPAEGAAEFAGGALVFGENGGKHVYSGLDPSTSRCALRSGQTVVKFKGQTVKN